MAQRVTVMKPFIFGELTEMTPGVVVSLADDSADTLRSIGVVAPVVEVTVTELTSTPEVATVKEPADTQEEEEPPEMEEKQPQGPERPKRVAPIRVWKQWAKHHGVTITDLRTKQEIIGACSAAGV